MIKNSSIPYFFTPPMFIRFIFDKPKSDFLLGIAQIIDIFASAYVTGLLFYFMVDYLPAVKQEKIAKEIIMPKLVSLYLYISEFIAMIEYAAKQENLFKTESIDDMDNLNIQDKSIPCKSNNYKNGSPNGTTLQYYNLLTDGDKYRTLILDICTEISSTPSFSYCDTKIINIISRIQLSELLRMFPRKSDVLQKLDLINVSHHGLGKGYQQLVSIQKDLSPFVTTRFEYEIVGMTKEEIESFQRKQEETLKENPELVKILTAIQKQNK